MITPDTDTLKLGLHTLSQVYSMPDYVKQASMDDISEETLNSLPNNVFADATQRCYPCHTKAATWVSLGYFLQDYNNIPDGKREELLDRFEKSAKYFGIMDDYVDLLSKTVALEKQATAVPKSTPVTLTEQGGELESEAGICKAAAWLVAQRNRLPLQKRAEMAAKILKQADIFHVNLPQRKSLEQTAGYGVNDPVEIISSIRTRSSLVKKSEYSHQLLQLANSLGRFISSPFDKVWVKVAYAIDDFDKLAGLIPSREAGKLPLPEEVVFTYPMTAIKEAEEESIQLTNGEIYSLNKLASVSRESYEDVLGPEVTDSMFDFNMFDKEAAAEILPTLPRIDANALSDMLEREEVKPAAKVKTAGYSLSNELFSIWN